MSEEIASPETQGGKQENPEILKQEQLEEVPQEATQKAEVKDEPEQTKPVQQTKDSELPDQSEKPSVATSPKDQMENE